MSTSELLEDKTRSKVREMSTSEPVEDKTVPRSERNVYERASRGQNSLKGK
ncbi:hypothetical protein MTP04_31470 [Lysinibacillus sp. PLM2]|nr:hypothetical protein MTP04_31470 [Lysinibacillus sp. PLM2]